MKPESIFDKNELNSKLEIASLKNKSIKVKHGILRYNSGFCFKISGLGYVGFKSDHQKLIGYLPYIPCGGVKALEEILEAGGFTDYNSMSFIPEAE